MTSKVTEEPDALSTARADLTDVSNLLYAAFMAADRLHAAVRKLTGIRSYRNDALPKIAVTVDLLTTGIDVPSIANLVFVRRVNSRILYEQMLGRATRLATKSARRPSVSSMRSTSIRTSKISPARISWCGWTAWWSRSTPKAIT
jgi:hypothetical protein